MYYSPGACVHTGTIEKKELHWAADIDISVLPASAEGATLTLPQGGSRTDLRNIEEMRSYAIRNGHSWYEHINGPLGRRARNGCVYLVTGCDKAQSWGVAAWSDVSCSYNISFSFKAASTAENSISWTYSKQVSSPVIGRTGTAGELSNGNLPNQCVFIRGFKISVSESIWSHTQPILIQESTVDAVMKKSASAPFAPSSSGTMSRLSPPHQAGNGGNNLTEVELEPSDIDDSDLRPDKDSDAIVEEIFQTSASYHPSRIINTYLIKKAQEEFSMDNAVAITHDDVWVSSFE